MKKINYRNVAAFLIAASCLAGGLVFNETIGEAKQVGSAKVLKSSSVQKAKIKKRTCLYNKKGHKLKKRFLKKGKKISIVGTIKKIEGKDYFSIAKNKFVPASRITILKATSNKPPKKPQNSVYPDTTKPTQEKHKAPSIADFSLNDFRQEFVKELNKERSQRGLDPVTEDTHLDEVVQERTPLLLTNFAHEDSTGNFILSDYLNKAGISRRSTAECLVIFPWGGTVDHQSNHIIKVKNGSSTLVADNMLYEYIYNDAKSNWGHRNILLDPNNKTIGIGAIADNGSNQIYSAIGMIN